MVDKCGQYVYIHTRTYCVQIHVAAEAKGGGRWSNEDILMRTHIHSNCAIRLLAWPMCNLYIHTEYVQVYSVYVCIHTIP